jgi:YgiT-type zinc finger domain-containing protein
MSDDGLEAQDIEQVIHTGMITQRFTHDPQGTRYEVTGETTDGRQASVVCRFLLFHGQTIYVDNVPAWVCTQCGEQYFDAPVYKRLEAIARQPERITQTVCFPLAEYAIWR